MAIHSKRSLENYLLIDNRLSGGAMQELPTLTCSHCQGQVVMNPLRTRDREYCMHCDHFICDGCGVLKKHGAACKTMTQIFDEIQNAAYHEEQAAKLATGPIVLTDV